MFSDIQALLEMKAVTNKTKQTAARYIIVLMCHLKEVKHDPPTQKKNKNTIEETLLKPNQAESKTNSVETSLVFFIQFYFVSVVLLL